MRVAALLGMVAILMIVLAGCLGAPGGEVGEAGGAITGGTAETGYPAVFSLAYEGLGGCTGTCITPRVGITAKHCVEGDPAEAFTALFGDTEEAPSLVLQVTALEMAPDADVALLAFEGECPAVIPYNQTPLEDHVGEPVVMVGFGVTTEEAGDAGLKRSGTATLFSVDPAEVSGLEAGELATSNDPAGTCNGDSGGPTFMTLGGTEVMVGVTSRGSLMDATEEWPCGMGRSIAVRADSHAELIDAFIAAHDPPDAEPPMDPMDPMGMDPAHVDRSGGCAAGGGGAPSAWSYGMLVTALLALARSRGRGRRG